MATNLTAVCISGSTRTFLLSQVQDALLANFHHATYEYFISTDTKPADAATALRIAPVRDWSVSGPIGPIDSKGQFCPAGRCHTYRSLQPFFRRFKVCYGALRREELARGFDYAYAFRIRPDMLFLKKIPPPGLSFASMLAPGNAIIYDDQLAVSLRRDARSILVTPAEAYNTCATREQWVRACGPNVRSAEWGIFNLQECEVPCPTMMLVSVVSRTPVRLFEAALLQPRVVVSRGENKTEYQEGAFCLKRALDEPWKAECRMVTGAPQTPGCMGC